MKSVGDETGTESSRTYCKEPLRVDHLKHNLRTKAKYRHFVREQRKTKGTDGQ